jgi:hypothetical protein
VGRGSAFPFTLGPALTDAPPSPPSDDQVTFLRATLGAERVRAGAVLAPYTTFRVGGPAERERIERYSASQATTRFGSGHLEGAIIVTYR